jgi:hypothetical protein
VFRSTFPLQNQYVVDNTNRRVVIQPKDNQPVKTLYLSYAPQMRLSKTSAPYNVGGQFYYYPDLASLQTDINAAFTGFSNSVFTYEDAPQGTTGGGPVTSKSMQLYGLSTSHCSIVLVKNADGVTGTCTLTMDVQCSMTEQDYSVTFVGSSWYDNLAFLAWSYALRDATPVGASMANVAAYKDVKTTSMNVFQETTTKFLKNNEFWVQPRANADSLSLPEDRVVLSVATQVYNRFALVRALNAALDQNPVTRGTRFVWSGDDLETVRIDWNINKVYTAQDYALTFFDIYSFGHCEPGSTGNSSLTTLNWDQTLGWLLGFRSLNSYDLNATVATNTTNPDEGYSTTNAYTLTTPGDVVTVQGDTPVNVNLYNQLHIVLDDFAPNHMNDGILTVAPPSVDASIQSYAASFASRARAARNCDVVNGQASVPGFANADPLQGRVPPLLTQAQLYSALAQNKSRSEIQSKASKNYSLPPNIKDMFALIPLKLAGLLVGQSYTEFGGTLQQNNRKYFGPVNISRIGLKLLSDRGDLVDLNNNDWSVGIIIDIQA